MKARLVDFLLLLLAGIFFILFCAATLYARRMTGLDETIAILTEGSAQIKPKGALSFRKVVPIEELHNLDSVWVGKGGKATLTMEDGTVLNLTEKTLLVLKPPFNRFKLATLSVKKNSYQLLQGGLELRAVSLPTRLADKRIEAPLEAEKPSPSPSPSPTASPSPEPSPTPTPRPRISPEAPPETIFPEVDQTLVITTDKTRDIIFSWPAVVTGTVVVEPQGVLQSKLGKAKKLEVPINSQKSVKMHIVPIPGEYEWHVADAQGKTVQGPYKYKIRRVDRKDLSTLIGRDKTLDSFIIF
jgi:hypothetical protein